MYMYIYIYIYLYIYIYVVYTRFFPPQVLNLDKGKKVSPFSVPALLPNTGSGIMAIELGCTGPNYGVVSACAAGSHAIGTALRHMQESVYYYQY